MHAVLTHTRLHKAIVKSMTTALCTVFRSPVRLLVSMVMTVPVLAMAQTATCDGGLFLSQNGPTQLSGISTATTPMTFTPVGGAVAGITYNALGYALCACRS